MKKQNDIRNKGYVSANSVAKLAGVSRSAVSRTFTDGASVSNTTRHKVLKAAEELNYHVNHLARGLMHERSNIISLLVSEIRNPFQSKLIEEITSSLQRHNRVALVINSDGGEASASRALTQSLNYRADATVILSGTPPSSLVDTCLANGQHVILINRDQTPTRADGITVDNEAAAREAFMLNMRAGCKHHVIVSTSNRTPSIVARETSYLTAAKEAGVRVNVVTGGPTTYESGYQAARMVFGQSETPDAAFCLTDLLALGFMDSARIDFNLKIPDELCLIGFDDIDQAAWGSYQLTTFRQPISEIANQIVELVIDDQRPNTGHEFKLVAQPVWRKTVRPR